MKKMREDCVNILQGVVGKIVNILSSLKLNKSYQLSCLIFIRFIGELFKQKILNPNIMMYCIANLVIKHVEEPLEYNLLKTVGKELEQVNLYL